MIEGPHGAHRDLPICSPIWNIAVFEPGQLSHASAPRSLLGKEPRSQALQDFPSVETKPGSQGTQLALSADGMLPGAHVEHLAEELRSVYEPISHF